MCSAERLAFDHSARGRRAYRALRAVEGRQVPRAPPGGHTVTAATILKRLASEFKNESN